MKKWNLLIFQRSFDRWIFFSLIFFSIFSLLALYSLAIIGSLKSFIFYKQLIFILIAFFIFFVFSNFNYKIWRSHNRFLYLLSVFSLVLVLIFGATINQTKGWFYIFGFGIQPVEFVKFSLIILLSSYFSKNLHNYAFWRLFLESAFLTFSLVFLVLLQPDLGSAFILIMIWLLYLFVASIPWKYILTLFISAILIIFLSWNFFLMPYQKDRLMVFVNPDIDPLGAGYNIQQSMIAIGSGQFLGRGLGLGSQSQLRFIPERTTDFIIAVLGEEFGFVGMLLLLLLWFVIFFRIFKIIKRLEDNFAYFILLGISMLFFLHIVINLGMNLGVMPVIGVSFPFISMGGSFLLISFLLMAVVENISVKNP